MSALKAIDAKVAAARAKVAQLEAQIGAANKALNDAVYGDPPTLGHGDYERLSAERDRPQIELNDVRAHLDELLTARFILNFDEQIRAVFGVSESIAVERAKLPSGAEARFARHDRANARAILDRIVDLLILRVDWNAAVDESASYVEAAS